MDNGCDVSMGRWEKHVKDDGMKGSDQLINHMHKLGSSPNDTGSRLEFSEAREFNLGCLLLSCPLVVRITTQRVLQRRRFELQGR